MIARVFLRCSCLVMTSFMLFATRSVQAACVISDAVPTVTLPMWRSDGGQRFLFSASADCATLEFTSGAFSTTPMRGPPAESGPRRYNVEIPPPVWDSLVRDRDTTFQWTVTGWTTAGVATEVTTTNDLDSDRDGWTRSEGDVGQCDQHPGNHPGGIERCDGRDQDCNGVIDDIIWFRDADGDNYGDDSDTVIYTCARTLSGYTQTTGDCDDSDATIHPFVIENCDDVDDDCDGFASCNFSLSEADAEYTGEAAEEYAGYSLAGAGDVDGDGYDDFVVGARGSGSSDRGAGYLLLGSASPADASLSAAAAKYIGEARYDNAGTSIAGAGDVDGDGYDDLIVGAAGNDDGGNLAGAAYLVLGGPSPTSALLSAADAKYTGAAANDHAGTAVAGAGDVNGDSYDDVLVGAYGVDGYGGAAYLVLGGPSPASTSLSAADVEYSGVGDFAGYSLAGAGDVDGDGYADVLVGAPLGGAGGGVVYLVLGEDSPASASLSSADAEYTGEYETLDFAGWSVAGAGDVDGDGYGDVLVGTPNGYGGPALAEGGAYLVLGGPSPVSTSLSDVDAKYTGEAWNDYAGQSVAGAGDVDRDGYDDMLVGAYQNADAGAWAGAGYLVLGGPSPASASLSVADAQYTGEGSGVYAGWSVAGAGDVDADGYADVLVGAPYNECCDINSAGTAYLLLRGGL